MRENVGEVDIIIVKNVSKMDILDGKNVDG
jgi:hypothetical protein